jgi:hypothetical protein
LKKIVSKSRYNTLKPAEAVLAGVVVGLIYGKVK